MNTSTDPSTNNVDVDTMRATTSSGSNDPNDPITPEERSSAMDWHKKIVASRAFDAEVRRLYARDRKYCRAESSLKVQYSLIQAYIDILVAFLVARDPEFEGTPAESVGQAGAQDMEDFAKTMSIVISHLLTSAGIKRKAARMVRSALSVGIGWLKMTWQEVWATDPNIKTAVGDLQENIAQVASLRAQIDSGDVVDMDLAMAQLKSLQDGVNSQAERMIASGMGMDVINPEDMLHSLDCDNVLDTDGCEWKGDRYFLRLSVAKAKFTRIPNTVWPNVTLYGPKPPEDSKKADESGMVARVTADDADSFVKGAQAGQGEPFVAVYEIWNGDNNSFFSLIDGIGDRFAEVESSPPAPTTRFFPYFGLSFTEVDGERHPQSYVQRSAHLQDEIERSMTSFAEHRARVKPKNVFDARLLSTATVKKLTQGTTAENIAVRTIGGVDTDLSKVFTQLTYPGVDMALYDISPFVRGMETIWGIQEALSSSVSVAKTATEADIQQAGTQAKTGYKRDVLEDVLSAMGKYCAEVASFKLTLPEVRQIAGAGAFWVQATKPEDLDAMIKIQVKAGSSGKPDAAHKLKVWGEVMPQIKELMEAIANLRQTPPPQLADNLEQLLVETANRMGENLDVKRFVPQVPEMPIVNPMTGQPMSNEQLAASEAAQAQAQAQGGKQPPQDAPPNGGPPPPQEQVAPTQLPGIITG